MKNLLARLFKEKMALRSSSRDAGLAAFPTGRVGRGFPLYFMGSRQSLHLHCGSEFFDEISIADCPDSMTLFERLKGLRFNSGGGVRILVSLDAPLSPGMESTLGRFVEDFSGEIIIFCNVRAPLSAKLNSLMRSTHCTDDAARFPFEPPRGMVLSASEARRTLGRTPLPIAFLLGYLCAGRPLVSRNHSLPFAYEIDGELRSRETLGDLNLRLDFHDPGAVALCEAILSQEDLERDFFQSLDRGLAHGMTGDILSQAAAFYASRLSVTGASISQDGDIPSFYSLFSPHPARYDVRDQNGKRCEKKSPLAADVILQAQMGKIEAGFFRGRDSRCFTLEIYEKGAPGRSVSRRMRKAIKKLVRYTKLSPTHVIRIRNGVQLHWICDRPVPYRIALDLFKALREIRLPRGPWLGPLHSATRSIEIPRPDMQLDPTSLNPRPGPLRAAECPFEVLFARRTPFNKRPSELTPEYLDLEDKLVEAVANSFVPVRRATIRQSIHQLLEIILDHEKMNSIQAGLWERSYPGYLDMRKQGLIPVPSTLVKKKTSKYSQILQELENLGVLVKEVSGSRRQPITGEIPVRGVCSYFRFNPAMPPNFVPARELLRRKLQAGVDSASKSKLAKQIGISRSTLNTWLKPVARISEAQRTKIEGALGSINLPATVAPSPGIQIRPGCITIIVVPEGEHWRFAQQCGLFKDPSFAVEPGSLSGPGVIVHRPDLDCSDYRLDPIRLSGCLFVVERLTGKLPAHFDFHNLSSAREYLEFFIKRYSIPEARSELHQWLSTLPLKEVVDLAGEHFMGGLSPRPADFSPFRLCETLARELDPVAIGRIAEEGVAYAGFERIYGTVAAFFKNQARAARGLETGMGQRFRELAQDSNASLPLPHALTSALINFGKLELAPSARLALVFREIPQVRGQVYGCEDCTLHPRGPLK